MKKQIFNWHCSLAGAAVRSIEYGVKLQIAGKQYQPDRVETGRIYVHVPKRFEIDTVQAKVTMVGSTGNVFALNTEASSDPVPWQLAFMVSSDD